MVGRGLGIPSDKWCVLGVSQEKAKFMNITDSYSSSWWILLQLDAPIYVKKNSLNKTFSSADTGALHDKHPWQADVDRPDVSKFLDP